MKAMATEVKPSAAADLSSAASASRSSDATTAPEASSLSPASTTPAYSGGGRRICSAKSSGLAWSPITRASAKPAVVTNRVRAPLRSSRALVATVVPILIAETRSLGNASPGATFNRRRMPSTAASG